MVTDRSHFVHAKAFSEFLERSPHGVRRQCRRSAGLHHERGDSGVPLREGPIEMRLHGLSERSDCGITGDPDNFAIFNSETVLGIYRAATAGIFAVLVGVVALSLVVGGIVIMNIMLMVVSERTREIGLRKALGAKRRDIMSQVLTESITLSTFGGLVGILLGFTLAMILAAVTPLPATLELWSILLGAGITAAVGLFFGAYPAARAAALDPIEALRRE